MPRWTTPVVAAVTAALLAAGLLGAVTVEPDGGGGSGDAASSTASTTAGGARSSAPTTGSAGAVADAVPSIQAFVEKERGLTFKGPVDVTLLDDERFEARVNESDEEDREDTEHAQAVLQAMGLLDDDVDLGAVVRSFTAGAVLGFYDPETNELVVRGARPTPFVRSVLAHELLHALEDQHFDLDREDLGDEAFLGFQALVEGSAVRIEDRYRQSLSRSEQREALREERARGGNVPDVPEVVQVLFGFPYAYGPDLVAAIERAGGRSRLDAAYADPPASSEQVMTPDRFLSGDEPRVVPAPAADGEVFDDGEIGQLFLALMLRSELPRDVARTAADGWGGDHYVAWEDGGRTCVRIEFAMDTPGDTADLTAALADWAAGRKGTATVTGTSVRTCG